MKPLLDRGEGCRNDLNHNSIPFHPRRSRRGVACRLDNLGGLDMKQNLPLAALMAMTSTSNCLPSFGTVSNPRRFKHRDEVEGDKKRAQRAEINRWNEAWEARKAK